MSIDIHENHRRTIPNDVDPDLLSKAQFPTRLAFSVKETAATLGVSEKTVRRLVARRLLNPSRALRHLLISKKEVERFLEHTTVKEPNVNI